MYVHRIEFSPGDDQLPEKTLDLADGFLAALRMNGQICGAEWPIYLHEGRYAALVLAPEQESLEPRFHGKSVKKRAHEGEALGISITSVAVAEDCNSAEPCSCRDPSGYVLFTTFLSLESPVRCLDCFLPVPLYRLPVTPSEEYYEVICWNSDYQSCDRLQMNCTVLERAATRELSDLRSNLSKAGRDNCSILARLSGKPFYYYLYRGHGRSVGAEKKRLCPSCGQPWYLETSLHSLFHFKCDQCRLLSNFAWNLSR